jgi:predicted RNase H-like HicB family nuclease
MTGGARMKVNVIIESDKHGYYAFCPELKCCHSQGDSLEISVANLITSTG